jgi:uncharacterized protein (DUF486 family)
MFMTFAWYDHLRNKQAPILATIFLCWLIALPEYALQVPANRIGNGVLSATQLKVIQEVISLSVFVLFAWWRLGEAPNWRTFIAMLFVIAAVWVVKSAPEPVQGVVSMTTVKANQ